jgi:hypothetical protein
MHLGWGDCAGAGSATAAFNNPCTSNTGAIPIIGSFNPPVPLTQMVAIECEIDIYTSATVMSPWWHMETQPSSGCRASQIYVSFDFTNGPYTCNDVWNGQAAGGMEYLVNGMSLGANTANIVMVAAISDEFPARVDPSNEYYAFSLRLGRAQSSGPGSCAGCSDRACIVLNYLKLDQPAGVGDFTITQGDQSAITYNGGGGLAACASARTQKSSWGAIKAIYH